MSTAILTVGKVDASKPSKQEAMVRYCKIIGLIGSRFGRVIGDAFKLGKDCKPPQLIGALSRANAKACYVQTLDNWFAWWSGRWGELAPIGKKTTPEKIAAKKKLVEAIKQAVDDGALEQLADTIKCLNAHYSTCGAFGDAEPITLRQVCQLIVAPAKTPKQMIAKFNLDIEADDQ